MQDDIVVALTQEVKEEVIQNYLYERRLIEEQINYVNELAEHTAHLEEKLYRRFARMYELLIEPEFVSQFVQLVGIREALFEQRFQNGSDYRNGLCFIKVRGLTSRAKFKKLLCKSYQRLFAWNKAYKEAYDNLEQESKAVNHNLKKFEMDYDLLTILKFLQDMDIEYLERKHFLGDNFTPEEIGAIEATLCLKPIRIEHFKLILPPDLPEPNAIQRQLGALASCVYGQCQDRIKKLMK
ncbi:MAG: hypothetical protein JRJ42_07890 [Deltaproteobacteria bacterium]|nr:hypothetical protein [Deltaproteobacteria bacterium]MBW2020479.1 hypothetical protein [Deltaproteobacteria bacterium]MBW2075188.1 hypothetical protein [Deltaproteobacteria bacterium]